MARDTFYRLPAATITSLITSYTTCLSSIALGQEYEIGGRRLRRSDLAMVKETLAELYEAQAFQANGSSRKSYTYASIVP